MAVLRIFWPSCEFFHSFLPGKAQVVFVFVGSTKLKCPEEEEDSLICPVDRREELESISTGSPSAGRSMTHALSRLPVLILLVPNPSLNIRAIETRIRDSIPAEPAFLKCHMRIPIVNAAVTTTPTMTGTII